MKGILGLLVTMSLLPSAWAKSEKINVEEALMMDSIVAIHNKIETLGWEQTLETAKWPSLKKKALSAGGNAQLGDAQGDDQFDDVCVYFPTSAECQQKNFQLREDGIQILAGEVLYQTLTFFKVKHVFVKLKTGNYGFRIVPPTADDASFRDLQTDQVVLAIKEFRKYVINLLCENPDPSRMLAMMNRFDVGTRFRWDMAWALLGNKLPDAANKYMRFGPRWEKFSIAIDSIATGSMARFPDAQGVEALVDPAAATAAARVPKASVGFIAKEVVGIVRLVGDVAAQVLQLFCVSDLSINPKLEQDKQLATYRLLSIKAQLKTRYAPLQAVIDEMNREAAAQSGDPGVANP